MMDSKNVHESVIWMKKNGGQGEIRTRGLYHAKVTIFQLIYLPSKIADILLIDKCFYSNSLIQMVKRCQMSVKAPQCLPIHTFHYNHPRTCIPMGVDRTTIVVAAVLVVICISGTLVTFGIGELLDDDATYPTYDITGTLQDGTPVTGTATSYDTRESSERPAIGFDYVLVIGGETRSLQSFLFLDTDGNPVKSMFHNVGQEEHDGTPVTLWEDSAGEFTYRIDADGNVLAIMMHVDGIDATAVQATP